MKANRFVSRVAGLGLAGALAVGCLSSQRETGTPLSLMARAALAAKADRVVRVIDADTYIMLSGSTTYRLRLLGVDAPEQVCAADEGGRCPSALRRRLAGV